MKGTPWVNKTARLRCRCGRTIHIELRGRCTIVYDSEPKDDRQGKVDSATPSSTLSTPYETVRCDLADSEGAAGAAMMRLIRKTSEQEVQERAEDDSDG